MVINVMSIFMCIKEDLIQKSRDEKSFYGDISVKVKSDMQPEFKGYIYILYLIHKLHILRYVKYVT